MNQPSPAPVHLVVFDLGRVFIRICDHWQQAFDRAGVAMPDCLQQPEPQRKLHALGIEHESGRLSNEDYYQQAGELTGLSPAQVHAIVTAWLIEPFEGIGGLVAQLRGRGVTTACLSNTNAHHWRMMHEDSRCLLPLVELDHRFASHLVGIMKPDAGIYEHVEKQTAVAARSILFFDDHGPNIAAASARGWQAVRIDTAQPQTVPQMTAALRERGLIA